MLYGIIGVLFVNNVALRQFDFRGWWSVTPKNGGEGAVNENYRLKSGAVILEVGTSFLRPVCAQLGQTRPDQTRPHIII